VPDKRDGVSHTRLNQLEPDALVNLFDAHPPQGFTTFVTAPGIPAFVASFDLLTTADDALRRRVHALPWASHWLPWLHIRTAFVGTTVTEYSLLPDCDASFFLHDLRAKAGQEHKLVIIKDIPQRSPLLDVYTNTRAEQFVAVCREQDFLLVEGQALAYVAIDFDSIDTYLERLSTSRRKNLRRKLRKREDLQIDRVHTGDACFADDSVVNTYYALYLDVYQQSEIHFDLLTREFFAAMLRDARNHGISFEYRRDGELIGYNLCFEHEGRLIDKYIGLRYPQARESNLYFISWFVNLEYALERGLKHYVAGWTDPQVKADLGASFTYTRHAVYIRNPLLRALARRFGAHFESDRQWSEQRHG
jgi:predicted N-acyltransferase